MARSRSRSTTASPRRSGRHSSSCGIARLNRSPAKRCSPSCSETSPRGEGVTPASRVAGSRHDRRVRFLESLAGLLGCTGHLTKLPDGRRPDVLAGDTRQRLLFVGEGKDSETPNCRATQATLRRYLQWVAAHLCHETATAVCAVCFGRERDARTWLDVLAMLARDVQVTFVHAGETRSPASGRPCEGPEAPSPFRSGAISNPTRCPHTEAHEDRPMRSQRSSEARSRAADRAPILGVRRSV